ncbi:AAA family ATPase [Aliarcobacter cryaerophilus]|uniref:AAA family ATPase n=1 Tax=Aliarcobacter cryaerophilus TaxID=28198 RepID=UPI003DA313A1
MPIRVDEIIEEILPNFKETPNKRSFYKTSGDTVYVENFSNNDKNRKGFSNQSDFDNKELFITKFGDTKGDNIQTMLFAKELSLVNENGVTSNTITNNTGDYIKIEEGETFNYKIINHISDNRKLPILIDLAVQKAKLKELIEAVVEIDNNLEPQEKLLPKIVAERDKLIEEDGRSNIKYKQLIIYGPAGVGKTYGIRNIAKNGLEIVKDNFEKQTVHTVFHPEYSYYDFFGKVMPIKDEYNQISYDFLPGPFAQALSKAYKNITKQPINPEKVILVVDELNRGNAASIFGGLFNLLDRNNIGISEYPLNIYGMEAMWLKEQIGDLHLSTLEKYSKKNKFEMYDEENKSLKIFIPDNLSIICTMNTSDQTIFSLDKAFQRRFNKNFITAQNSINEYFKDDNIKIKDKDKDKDEDEGISWKNFLLNLNKFIVDHAEVEDVDNATIGAFFVKPKDGYILIEDIKYTIMYYLWYDLFSGYRRETLKEKLAGEIQKVKTFEEFVDKYEEFIKKISSSF